MSIFMSFAKKANKFVTKHSPELLAGLGIGGFFTTVVIVGKASPKVSDEIKEATEEKGEELTAKEKLSIAWKPYLPAVVTGAASTICVIGSVSESLRRNAALATAYEISKNIADEYKAKVIETIGEKKAEKIERAIEQDHIDKNPPQQNVNVLIPPDDGQHRSLYYEPITKKYFWEKPNKVDRAAIDAMKAANEEAFELQYSAYSWISKLPTLMAQIPDDEIDYLQDIGWPTTSLYGTDDFLYIDTTTNAKVVTKGEWEGYPCIYIKYGAFPAPDYRRPY